MPRRASRRRRDSRDSRERAPPRRRRDEGRYRQRSAPRSRREPSPDLYSEYSYSYDDFDYDDRRPLPRRGRGGRGPRSRSPRRGERRRSKGTPDKPLFTELAYRSKDDLDIYNEFCEKVGIKGRVIAKIRGMMQNMWRDDLARLLEPAEVDNIRKAENPIGMAINRIRTIERESGRPKEMAQRKGSGKGNEAQSSQPKGRSRSRRSLPRARREDRSPR
ncbi:unnamed protein product [Effrenium voratum]|uniref:Uncharacterized protein n=1 Tax=Effrenium voratum TaxID=2562239 RepID=A0AA36IEN7_9DINO|nr:unnamed protein product [Effrenium voratum]